MRQNAIIYSALYAWIISTHSLAVSLAYGIDWLTFSELKEAIPPAYTQFIGEQMKQHLVT